MKIAISAESTVDLSEDILQEYDIKTVPFTIALGDRVGLDGQIASREIIEYVTDTKRLPKTSAVNEKQFEEHFACLLKEYDGVVHFSLSENMSSAYQNAVSASKKFKNVFVLDTASLSTGIALLAIYGRNLANSGASAKEIYEKCLERVPYVQASFELKRVDYLYKGGRCSMLSLLGANLLKIRPQILVKEGKMVSGKKYRGKYEYVVKNYCADILEEFDTPDLSVCFVTYTTAEDEVLNCAISALKDRGFKKIYVTHAGGTITSHCGEDCLGILYINDGKEGLYD